MNPALKTLVLAFREHCDPESDVLFLGAEAHPDLRDVVAWQPLKPLADECVASGMKLTADPAGEFQTVLFLPGKAKDEILAGFAAAHDLLAPGGKLLVALANTAGAARFEKTISLATPLRFSITKNKSRAFVVSKSDPWDAKLLGSWRELATPRRIDETSFTVVPGVFSANHIDPGSALLAHHLPPTMRGDVADIGAGWGYLSCVALEKAPSIAHIDLFEADARALACARENVSGAVAFHWHDVTTGLPGKYDHIIMNPPFHSGQVKDVDLGKAFLSVAASALKRGGTLHLVANRQLPYEAHLVSLGLRSRLIAETHTFKVIFCS